MSDWYFDQGKGVGTAIINGENPFYKLPKVSDDFWIGNFECVCADIKDKNYPFVISPSILSKISHLNLYGIANNHIMQAGKDAFDQTIRFMEENGIRYAGANNRRSTSFYHQDKKIGFMAFSMRPDNFSQNTAYWHLPELEELKLELQKLEDCYFRIVFVHWGYEFINRPNFEQRQLAHWLVDEGADLIVGMHPHVMQGVELYHDRYIFYSLGNSVFNMAWDPTHYGLMINVDLSKDKPIVWSDYIKIGNDFFPEIVKDIPYQYTREYLDSLLTITEENEKYFEEVKTKVLEYTRANRITILKRLFTMPLKLQFAVIYDFIKRRFLTK